MSKVSKVIVIIIIIAVLCGAFYLIYDNFFSNKPHQTVGKLLDCINEKDINGIATCFEPKVEKMYNATSRLLSSFIGVDLRDAVDLFPVIYDLIPSDDGLYEIRYKIISEEIIGDSAQVTCEIITLDSQGNIITSGTDIVYLKKFNVGWRIVNL